MPGGLLDLGCGLNPLAVPWMGIGEARYRAIDVDAAALGVARGFLESVGQPYVVEVRDLVRDVPAEEADVGLLLKLVTTLDRQDPDAATRLLRGLRVDHAVVSFAARSLSGRGNHERTYRARLERLVEESGRVSRVVEASVPGELVFVLELGRPMAEPLVTRRGTLAVPTFLPDATRAGVRGLTSDDLRGIGIEGVVVNAFHLLRRPGARVIQAAGGIHRFMDWSGPILSDSGGFQVLEPHPPGPRTAA